MRASLSHQNLLPKDLQQPTLLPSNDTVERLLPHSGMVVERWADRAS